MKTQLVNTVRTFAVTALASGLISGSYGCSVFMQITRPTPVDMSQFSTGEKRVLVREQLGAPFEAETESDGEQCDTYALYTRGYRDEAKIPIAMTEAAADAFTFGLAEIVLTPVEIKTRNSRYPVTFCYQEDRLASVTQSDTPLIGR